MGDDRLLIPGQTCWRVARADQFACVIDAADYFKHVKAAMLRARHRIMMIGWDFDARMTFERGVTRLPGPNQLGAFLYWMLWKRPALEVYLLKSNLRLLPAFDGIWFGLTPVALVNQISSRRLHFAVDGAVRPVPSITRRSWSSTMQWRSVVASTSPSIDGTPARISVTVAAVGRWGAAMGRDTTWRQQLTVRPRVR